MTFMYQAHRPTSPHRYQAADFHKLTNRRASSPRTPEFCAAREQSAEQTTNRECLYSADKRPILSGRPVSCGSQHPSCRNIRLDSYSSVKEEGRGKLMYIHNCNPPFGIALD